MVLTQLVDELKHKISRIWDTKIMIVLDSLGQMASNKEKQIY
jgi:hypothetical protein